MKSQRYFGMFSLYSEAFYSYPLYRYKQNNKSVHIMMKVHFDVDIIGLMEL